MKAKMKKNGIDALEKDIQSMRAAKSDIANEERRIVEEFKTLLIWIEDNLPKDITLPFGSSISNSVFRCTVGSDQDDLEWRFRDPKSVMSIGGDSLVIYLVRIGFTRELRKTLKASVRSLNGSATKLRKLSVPQSL